MTSVTSPSATSRRDDTVVIRLAVAADASGVERLAALDGAPRPLSGTVLVAEADGELAAALSVESRRVVADPFRPTADLVSLLTTRAQLLRGADRVYARRPGVLRRLAGVAVTPR